MIRPKENPSQRRPSPRQPSAPNKQNPEDLDRPGPGRRTSEYDRQSSRGLNTDQQRKVVNERDPNAQSQDSNPRNDNTTDSTESSSRSEVPSDNSNERIEAPDDQNEVNPRSPKVN